MKLDEIMCGRNGQIIEIVGETGTGKTQFAHLMAIKQAINTKGFTVYIDSGGNFAPKRLVQLCKPFTLDENVVKDLLRRIIWIQCFQKSDLELALQELNDGMGLNIELIIIDSMRSILGSVTEIVGHNNLRTLAKKLNTPILVLNLIDYQ